MGDVGASWDNTVVERFFGSLKHDWIFKIAQPTRGHMKKDVAAYLRYYNLERLHAKNGDQSPVNYEKSLKKCPVGLDQYIFTPIPLAENLSIKAKLVPEYSLSRPGRSLSLR